MFRTNNDQASSFLWFVFGAIISMVSIRYNLGTLDSPGTGFLPFLAGLAISFFSMIGLVHSTLKLRKGEGWKPVMKGVTREKSLIVLGALFAFALLLKPLGFSLCAALFIGFLLRAVQPQSWLIVTAGGILTAIGTYGIFEIWLQAQLPKGPWGF
jgi:putative tricarboxylic transport membrane protein